jgi:hypothetical protein
MTTSGRVLPESERAFRGPDRTYSLGPYRFGRYGWRTWDVSHTTRGRGVGPVRRNPLAVFLRLQRWLREPVR